MQIFSEMKKELFAKRGVEYKLEGLYDRIYNADFLLDQVEVERDEIVYITHTPVSRTCDFTTKLPFSRVIDSSFVCPECDLFSRQKVLNKLRPILNKYGIDYELDFYLDDIEKHVPVFLTKHNIALIYIPSINQKSNFGDLFDDVYEELELFNSSKYISEVVYFTGTESIRMEEWLKEFK